MDFGIRWNFFGINLATISGSGVGLENSFRPFFNSFYQISDLSRSFGRPVYQFWCPNCGVQKTLFNVYFFSCTSTRICSIAVNDFTMHVSLEVKNEDRREKCL